MSLVEIDHDPSKTKLRQFGWAAAVALPLAGWLSTGASSATGTLSGLGLAIGFLGWKCPLALRTTFILAQYATAPIGWVVGEIVLMVVYFGVVTPIGLVRQVVVGDVLGRRFDPAATSYWQPKAVPVGADDYFRPFRQSNPHPNRSES